MKNILLLTFAFTVATSITGCSQETSSTSNRKLLELESKLNELESKYRELSLYQTLEGFEHVAYLTPGQEGYTVVKTRIGVLTVSLDDVKPYANGTKVTLIFGNPTSATVDGLKAKFEWGSVGKDGLPEDTKTKSKEVRFSEPLLPGTWTKTSVVLDGVPPAELGFVRVRDVSYAGIKLRVR